MYTNIATGPAIHEISKYLKNQSSLLSNPQTDALIEAIDIVFNTCVVKFGDTYWK